MNITIDFRKDLEAKELRLINIQNELKNEFFGIDEQIEKIMDCLRPWYLIPEIIMRPLIINLWGLTGVGKTALVRSLVQKLDFSNRFVEIAMDGISANNGPRKSSIYETLQMSSIREGEAGIVLLDEFQRFRTISSHGEDVALEGFQDAWDFLSDGRFSLDHSFLSNLEFSLMDYEYSCKDDNYDEIPEDLIPGIKRASKKKKRKKLKPQTLYPYECRMIKNLLHLKESYSEIMKWDKAHLIRIIRAHMETGKNDPPNYSRCLIFVAGNIDEAFSVSGEVQDCDTNADLFYEQTKKIGVIEIKEALAKRFKPEQIARFGNNHIVYPSLKKSAYLRIIRENCLKFAADASQLSGIKFNINDEIYTEIYENSVYPAQGTRPVFSSIHKLFGSPLSRGILWAIKNEITGLDVSLDVSSSSLIFKAGGKSYSAYADFDVRKRKMHDSLDFLSMVAVHEMGHAFVHYILFGIPPKEISINIVSYKGGYVYADDEYQSKEYMFNRIAVLLSGTIAEKIVFGDKRRSSGCENDIMHATEQSGKYVRQFGFHDSIARVGSDPDFLLYQSSDSSDINMESLLKKANKLAESIIFKNKKSFVEMALFLLKIKKMDRNLFLKTLPAGVIPRQREPQSDDSDHHYNKLLLDCQNA